MSSEARSARERKGMHSGPASNASTPTSNGFVSVPTSDASSREASSESGTGSAVFEPHAITATSKQNRTPVVSTPNASVSSVELSGSSCSLGSGLISNVFPFLFDTSDPDPIRARPAFPLSAGAGHQEHLPTHDVGSPDLACAGAASDSLLSQSRG